MAEEPEIRHARGKEIEPDDPMELVFVPVPGGDPEIMATSIVEEFARVGMEEKEILELFRQPIYRIHAFYREYGEQWVRNLIRKVLARCGRLRISVTVLHHIGGCDA